jgi:hypothetical protein
MTTLLAASLFFLIAIPSYSQTTCLNMGNIISCTGPNGSRSDAYILEDGYAQQRRDEQRREEIRREVQRQEEERRSDERRRSLIYGDDQDQYRYNPRRVR